MPAQYWWNHHKMYTVVWQILAKCDIVIECHPLDANEIHTFWRYPTIRSIDGHDSGNKVLLLDTK
jgi:hypothetical protein